MACFVASNVKLVLYCIINTSETWYVFCVQCKNDGVFYCSQCKMSGVCVVWKFLNCVTI